MPKALFFDEDMDWDGPPWLTLYRWKCWIIGHRPEPLTLVDPKTGRETPQVWCWRCGKKFEVEMARSVMPPARAHVLERARQPLALPRASSQVVEAYQRLETACLAFQSDDLESWKAVIHALDGIREAKAREQFEEGCRAIAAFKEAAAS